jgi:antirestriction protein ArdC
MNIYADVTARIVSELEAGAAPWVKAWQAGSAGADCNAFSSRPYSGINRLILAMSGVQFASNRWATFKQWSDAGGSVRKGSKGTHVTFYKPTAWAETNDAGDTVQRQGAVLKSFVVFNADQVDGVTFAAPEPIAEPERIARCEQTITATGAVIRHGGDVACYVPSADLIRMPHAGAFDSMANYYATMFHELTHWTGAKHRCDRDLSGRFGNSEYAFEELVAELGAAFLCADHSIQGDLRHAGYIDHWIKCLRENDRAIFKAAALAERAAGFVRNSDTIEDQAAA